MAHRYGTDTVLPGGLSHDMSGLLVFVLAVIGVTLTAILAYIERRVLFWHASSAGV